MIRLFHFNCKKIFGLNDGCGWSSDVVQAIFKDYVLSLFQSFWSSTWLQLFLLSLSLLTLLAFSILNDLVSLYFFQSISHPLCLCLSALQFYISVAIMAGLSVASVALVPPPHLPDLFPVLVSTTAFLHFFGTFVYFNVVQFSGPPSRKSQKKKNWMVPKGSDAHCLLWMCMEAITHAIMSQVQIEQMYNCNNELMERKWIDGKKMNWQPFWKRIHRFQSHFWWWCQLLKYDNTLPFPFCSSCIAVNWTSLSFRLLLFQNHRFDDITFEKLWFFTVFVGCRPT